MPERSAVHRQRRAVTENAVRPQVLLFVEGEKTEVSYFNALGREYRNRLIISVDGYHGPPFELVRRALSAKTVDEREARRGRGRAYDEVWCAFDRDTHARFDEAIELARNNGIKLAISNPCIEVWFLLHFRDHAAHLECDAACALLQREPGLSGYKKLVRAEMQADLDARFSDAKQRAIALDDLHFGNGSPAGSNPSSGLWRLVDSLRDYAERAS